MTRVLTWRIPAAGAVAAVLAALMLWPSGAQADHLEQAGLELPDLAQVTAGWMHSCGVTPLDAPSNPGKVYCWGNNATANLGDGTFANARPLAKRVDGIADPVVQVSAGADHTCAVTTTGVLWCWGGSLAGQMTGFSTNTVVMQRTPAPMRETYRGQWDFPPGGFVSVSAGNTHSCALAAAYQAPSGRVPAWAWCWGDDDFGQMGDGGDINFDSSGAPRPIVLPGGMSEVRKVVAGASHNCAITIDNALWCWGDNGSGQLGDGTTTHRTAPTRVMATGGFPANGVQDVALGTYHTCAVTTGGEVYCWGDNTYGRIGSSAPGNPTAQGPDSLVPQKVMPYPGSRAETGIPGQPESSFANAVGVSAGLDHSCAWTHTGFGWCWGRAAYGHLGDGIVASNQPKPRYQVVEYTLQFVDTGAIEHIAAGYNHTCSLNAGGKAHCWGHNGFGQVGDGTFVFHYRPAKVFQADAPV